MICAPGDHRENSNPRRKGFCVKCAHPMPPPPPLTTREVLTLIRDEHGRVLPQRVRMVVE